MAKHHNPFPYYVWESSYSDCIHYYMWRCKLTKKGCPICLGYTAYGKSGAGKQCKDFKAKEGLKPPTNFADYYEDD